MELDIPFTQARTPNLFPYNIYLGYPFNRTSPGP